MIKANPEVTKELILDYISQEEMMEKYLGIYPRQGEQYCSPLRNDKNPTCTFKWINGTLYFRDWAEDEPLDCFAVVKQQYGVSFREALKIIASDFNLIKNIDTGKRKKISINKDKYTSHEKSIIQVKVSTFKEENIAYLKQYGITSEIAKKYNVYSPEYVWLNGKLVYGYNKNDPALAYYFGVDENGNEKWKIYFYTRENYRFITNTNRINGWIQIPESGDRLIITKSLKDVMCFDIFNVNAVAMQAESQTPYDYIIEELKQRFKHIITLYDYDKAGITRAKEVNQLYEIPYYFIKDDNAKDFSDYIKFYGLQKAEELTKLILNGTIKRD